MSGKAAVILWFRQDLRLDDNPALMAGLAAGLPIIPVYIWAPQEAGEWAPGSASRVWLHGSLLALQADLQARNSALIIRDASFRPDAAPDFAALELSPPDLSTAACLIRLAEETGAREVHCNARYEPWARTQQEQVKAALARQGVTLRIHPGAHLMWEPDSVATQQGKPYQVFTPFFNRCLGQLPETTPQAAPKQLPAPQRWPQSLPVERLSLLPAIRWDGEIRATWQPGEAAAQQRLHDFLGHNLVTYGQARNTPSQQGTSCFSSYLAHGELSPRRIWHAVESFVEDSGASPELKKAASAFLRELVWREFAYHVLFHFPHTVTQPLKPKFAAMPWRENPEWLAGWQQGKTGYPLVDAGMRQLWRTGWMHNRVRMVVGSFLTKDLLIPWQDGARWFWDTLVDADLASNSLNWQWVAGCGADAQPFFRIFNPVSQSQKFDPHGAYIRRWVPELDALNDKRIHAPWQVVPLDLLHGGITLGQTYPAPLVDHGEARAKALQLYGSISAALPPGG